ncbi:sulfatase [bacterium]
MHFMDVHNPYNPPSPYNKMFTSNNGIYIYNNGLINISAEDLIHTKGLYDGEIRFLDEKIHNLFNHLKELNILNRTMLIINSDHGEEFMDHNGMGHGTTLYNELINVPLIIHVPPIIDNYKNIKKSVIHSRVRNIDILPTILDALKISQNTRIDGVSLLPFILGEKDSSSPLPSLASVKSQDTEDILTSISRDSYKYIHNITQKTSELYDRQNDPKERENLIKSMPEIAHKMHEEILSLKLNYYGPSSNGSTKTSIDKKTIEKLKSLGYF